MTKAQTKQPNVQATGSVTAKGLATRQRILDAAEIRFLEHGFKGASLREIAATAGVEQGLISYYFKSKEELFQQVLGFRLEAAFKDQFDALKILIRKRAPEAPTVREILLAYADTTLPKLAQGDLGLSAIVRLTMLHNRSGSHRHLLEPAERLYAPIRHAYIEALQQARPDLSEEVLIWGFNAFQVVYADAVTSINPARGKGSSAQLALARRYLADFYAAGFEGLAPLSDR